MYDPVHRLDDHYSTQAKLAVVEYPVEKLPAVKPRPIERVGLAIVTLFGIAVWALIFNAIWGTLANL